MNRNINQQTVRRLPMYLEYLEALPEDDCHKQNISATAIAEALSLNDVQVRKDLATVSSGGRPKVGYVTDELITDIKRFLGYYNNDGVIIAGAGNFGRGLLSFEGFEKYGLKVLAGFDRNSEIIGTEIHGLTIYPVDRMKEFCAEKNVHIGIITVPEHEAQEVCDIMVKSGITAILNFACVQLNAPENVSVQNQNIAFSLAMLSRDFL